MLELKNILEADYDNIKKLTTKHSVMKHIGNGKIWNENKIKKFIDYNLEDNKLNDYQRENYYYKIVINNTKSSIKKSRKSSSKAKSNKAKSKQSNYKFIGIIGFHKFFQINDKIIT